MELLTSEQRAEIDALILAKAIIGAEKHHGNVRGRPSGGLAESLAGNTLSGMLT